MNKIDKPLDMTENLAHLTGLEQMNLAFSHGSGGPEIGKTMDFRLVSVDKGEAVFEGTPGKIHMNPIGSIHGGYAATLLDSALGCSIHTTLEPGERYTTVDLNVKYLRAMRPGMGKVTCTGTVVHKGRKIATAEARLVGEDGKIYAHGSTTCIIL